MLSEYTREELSAGIDRVVDEVLAEAGVEEPPVDAFAVARALGIEVALDDLQQGRARYVRLADRRLRRARPTILLRSEPRPERQQWAVAHEVGEHLACQVFAAWGADPREASPGARETVANSIAGRLLLPSAWFDPDAAVFGWDLLTLKTRYSTASHELVARRMLESGPPVIVTVFDNGGRSWRKSNLAGRVPGPSRAELECWRCVHHGNRPFERRGAGQRIRGWPVHEEGWRREILRTEIEEIALELCENEQDM